MKPINDEAFKNICEDFSCSCFNFCSEATYITMEEIAHDCDPFTYEEEEVENNFIENIVCKIYEMVTNEEGFEEYKAQYLYPAIEIRWESHKSKENNPTIEEPTSLSYFTSYDYGDFDGNFDSFLEDIDYDFLNKYLERCWDRACVTDKPFSLEEVIEMLIADGNKGKIVSPKSNK